MGNCTVWFHDEPAHNRNMMECELPKPFFVGWDRAIVHGGIIQGELLKICVICQDEDEMG